MATPRFAWGIDVGNRALKAIKLVRDGDQLRIDDFDVIEHEQILSEAGDNRESLLQTALATFAQKHSAKGGVVSIGVSGQASFARFIKLPPVDPSKIPEIVKFEAVQQIPFPLEEVEWSYQLFQSPESPEVEVGIFAMKRELVNQAIQNFTDVGLQVTTVQMNPLAVYNGLYYDDRVEGTTMIVDIGAENSDLIIAEGENIWMRSIPIGGNNFTEALVKSFKLKFPKAEELKRNAATSKYGRQILQAMKPVFSDLVGEIQRSIGFYSSTHRDSRIVKVLALGGTFRLPGLQKYLQQNLTLDVVRIDRLNAPAPADARFVAEFNENILSSVGAYGLALQAMGQAKITSSLLPEKIRRERMWKEKTIWFAAASLLIVAGTAIPVGKLYADKVAFANQEPVRGQIASGMAKGKSLDGKWRTDVENSGAEDRNQITNYLGLLDDRDQALDVTSEIGKAIPVSDAKEFAKKRGDRQIVEFSSYTMRYEPDLTGALAMTDDQFNELLDKSNLQSLISSAPIPVAPTGPTGRRRNTRPTWDPDRPPPSYNPGGNGGNPGLGGPNTPPPSAGDPTAANAKRGYIITLICRTPYNQPTGLITSTVVQYLRSRNLKSPNPPKGYSIERVTIPNTSKMTAVYQNGNWPTPKIPLIYTPPVNPANGQVVLPQLPVPPSPPTITPGAPLPPELFPDPMRKGESTIDDSLVTVLVAVLVDPPPLPATEQKH